MLLAEYVRVVCCLCCIDAKSMSAQSVKVLSQVL
jgi:hypothetical protein